MIPPRPSGRDLVVATMSAQGRSVARIATEVEVSPQVVVRTRRRHRAWIDAERERVSEEVAAGLITLAEDALDGLRDMLRSPVDPVKLGACRFVLESALKWRDQIDTERRLAALEDAS